MPGLIVVGGVVVLYDTWLALVADALSFQSANLWREARLRPSRRQQELHEAIMSAMAATGVREDTIPAPTTHDDYMNIVELAAELQCSVRHARRVADRLDPRFDGRTKLVSRQAVLEHLRGLHAAC
jgi:hypothetical protein